MAVKSTPAQRARAKRLMEAMETPANQTRPTSPLEFINQQMRNAKQAAKAKKKSRKGTRKGRN